MGEPDADELRGHQQHQAIGRRDQAERQRRDQHHTHVHGIDVAGLGQRIDQRHEDDDGRHRLDEVADDGEQQHQQQHDQMRIVAGEIRDPFGDHQRAAQIGEQPAERIGCADGDQRQRKDQTRHAEIPRQLLEMAAIEQWDHHNNDPGHRHHAGFGRCEEPGENAAKQDHRDHHRQRGVAEGHRHVAERRARATHAGGAEEVTVDHQADADHQAPAPRRP